MQKKQKSSRNLRSTYALIFCFYLALFSAYNLTLVFLGKRDVTPVSLMGYQINNSYTPQTLIYYPAIASVVRRGINASESYIKENSAAPSIRPKFPIWIGALLYKITGNNTRMILLCQSIFPALTATLLTFFFASFVPVLAAFALTLLGIAEIPYTVFSFVITKSFRPFFYHVENHLLSREYSTHLPFQRFPSPGFTLILAVSYFLLLSKDTKLKSFKNAAALGFIASLNLFTYPHQLIGAVLLTGILLLWNGLQSKSKISGLGKWAAYWLGGFLPLGLIHAVKLLSFLSLPEAKDILERVGHTDNYARYFFWPLMIPLAVALIFYAVQLQKKKPLKSPFLALFTLSALLELLVIFVVRRYHAFPQPWITPYRIYVYFVPLLAIYPFLDGISKQFKENGLNIAKGALAGFCCLCVFGEIKAGKMDYPKSILTGEMLEAIVSVKLNTPEDAIVMPQDYFSAVYLVNETGRYSYVDHGLNSNRSHREILQRAMVPYLIQGFSTEAFMKRIYNGHEGHPFATGRTFLFHHGSDDIQITDSEVADLYSSLKAKSPRTILNLYPFDAAQIPKNKLAARFLPYIRWSTDNLFIPQGAAPRRQISSPK